MFGLTVNWMAVAAATVASFLIGMLWYGPIFGKKWMSLMGYTKKTMKSMKMTPMESMSIGVVGMAISAFVLAHIVALVKIVYPAYPALNAGLFAAGLIWVGFAMTSELGSVTWENRPWALFILNSAHNLISLLVMGAIIGFWV
jgi:hypothetical protein